MGLSFKIEEKLIKLAGRGSQLYLPVKWRLVMLRDLYPEAKVETQVLSYDPDPKTGHATVMARIELPNGAVGTGVKQESAQHFPDFLEKAECVPLDYDILTLRGFRRYDQVSPGELVYAYDLERRSLAVAPLGEVKVYRRGQRCWEYRSRVFSMILTAGHTVVARNQGRERLAPWNELNTHDDIVIAAPLGEPVEPVVTIAPEEARALGRLLVQPDPAVRVRNPFMARLRPVQALHQAPPGLSISAMVKTRLAELGVASEEDLVLLPARMPLPARQAFLHGLLDGSGEILTSGRPRFLARPRSFMIDLFQITAALCGQAVGEAALGRGQYKQPLRSRPTLDARSMTSIEVAARPVWCPVVPGYGTWIARSPDGFVFITGNTGAIGRACTAAGIGVQYSTEYDLEETSPKAYPGVDTGFAPEELGMAKPLSGAELKVAIARAVEKIGKEAFQQEALRRFGTASSRNLTDEQYRELLAWARETHGLEEDH